MTWQTEMVTILRDLITDPDAVTYSNSRLEHILVTSAQLIQSTVNFNTIYTIDVELTSISPDPTDNPKDNDFINLTCLKAATIILHSEAKTLAAQAYRIVDGPSTIDVSTAYKAVLSIYSEMKKDLDKALVQYQCGNAAGGQAILTPYTNNSWRTNSWRGYYRY